MGDGDDKNSLLEELGFSAVSSMMSGLSGMPTLETIIRNLYKGNNFRHSLTSDIDPFLGDIEKLINSAGEKNFVRTLISFVTSGVTGVDANTFVPLFETFHMLADDGALTLDEASLMLMKWMNMPKGMIKDIELEPRDNEMPITDEQRKAKGITPREQREINEKRINNYFKRVSKVYNYWDYGMLGDLLKIEDLEKSWTPAGFERVLDTYADYLMKRDEYKEFAKRIKEITEEVKREKKRIDNTRIYVDKD
jgi:hypothetical protein